MEPTADSARERAHGQLLGLSYCLGTAAVVVRTTTRVGPQGHLVRMGEHGGGETSDAEQLFHGFGGVDPALRGGESLFIVGGGISVRHEDFLPQLQLDTPIVPAQLRNAAGVIGAARHASLTAP